MSRVCITGPPRTGKTTRANASGGAHGPVHHTDSLISIYGWSELSAVVASWFDEPGPWIVEGVAVPRALRKWLTAHAEGAPCDQVLVLEEAKVPLTPGQKRMAKGVWTVWNEVEPELARRGVLVVREP